MEANVTFTMEATGCDPSCCVRELVVLYEGEEFREYLEYHVGNYQRIHRDISITLQDTSDIQSSPLGIDDFRTYNALLSEGDNLLGYINNMTDAGQWDGVVFPGHMVGALKESHRLWSWNEYLLRERDANEAIDNNPTDIQWADIQPFYRSQAQQYAATNNTLTPSPPSLKPLLSNPDDADRETFYVPLDGDVLALLYRKDLFEKYNVEVPRTWDDYRAAAAFFHGKPFGPNNTTMTGSCVSRKRRRCDDDGRSINAYWASLVLSTMTQTKGTSTGFLLNPDNLDPILGDAMQETLRILAEQSMYEDPNELTDCDHDINDNSTSGADQLLEEGTCAMAYTWANRVKTSVMGTYSFGNNIGIARTPGSGRVLDRETGSLETCTSKLCPHGTFYSDIKIVNQPVYAAFGGWVAGVSNDAPSESQRAMASFFSYLSNKAQSFQDALPNERSAFLSPYRYSHLSAYDWINAGIDATTAVQYTETVKKVNSQNTVSEIRIPPGSEIRDILDQEVYRYLTAGRGFDNATKDGFDTIEDATLRAETTNNMDVRIREAISNFDKSTVLNNYVSSLGYSRRFVEGKSMNYIEKAYRDTGWFIAALICSMSIGTIVWFLWNRNKSIMRAFQPFLSIQVAVGLFLMGGTLIPLGFDDSLFGKEVLDISCVVAPWIYILGFSIFFSAVYSRIRCCLKIFNNPGKYERMIVKPKDSIQVFCQVFALNGILLGLWTFLDPLTWQRREKMTNGPAFPSSDGTVETYGSCQSEDTMYHSFGMAIFFYNLILCLIAMLQALKCRLLVLEYHQMQWLQLSILPFFEAWIIGGPVLTLLYDRPTAQYILFSVIIASSSISAALVILAPTEWYLRKNRLLEIERQKNNKLMLPGDTPKGPPQSCSTGVRVLKHPKVESQKHVRNLQSKLERYKTSNTELAIEIRILHEKFRKLTEKEKLHVVRGMFAKEITDWHRSRIVRTAKGLEEDDWLGLSSQDFGDSQMPAEDGEEEKSKVDTALTKGLNIDEGNSGASIDDVSSSSKVSGSRDKSSRSLSLQDIFGARHSEDAQSAVDANPLSSTQLVSTGLIEERKKANDEKSNSTIASHSYGAEDVEEKESSYENAKSAADVRSAAHVETRSSTQLSSTGLIEEENKSTDEKSKSTIGSRSHGDSPAEDVEEKESSYENNISAAHVETRSSTQLSSKGFIEEENKSTDEKSNSTMESSSHGDSPAEDVEEKESSYENNKSAAHVETRSSTQLSGTGLIEMGSKSTDEKSNSTMESSSHGDSPGEDVEERESIYENDEHAADLKAGPRRIGGSVELVEVGDTSMKKMSLSTVSSYPESDSVAEDLEKNTSSQETGFRERENVLYDSSGGSLQLFEEVEESEDAPSIPTMEFAKSENEEEHRPSSVICEEIEDLDKMIETDDFEELGLETNMMAEQFKLNSTFLENISDLQSNGNGKADAGPKSNGFHELDISNISVSPSLSALDSGSKDSTTPSATQQGSPQRDSDDSGGTDPVSFESSNESDGVNTSPKLSPELKYKVKSENDPTRKHVRGPSSNRSCEVEEQNSIVNKVDGIVANNNVSNDGDGANSGVVNSLIPVEYGGPPLTENESETTLSSSVPSLSPIRVAQSGGLDPQLNAPRGGNSNNNDLFPIEGWTATGTVGGLLADLSDSTATSVCSNAESMTGSISSMEVARAPSYLDIPMANEIGKRIDILNYDAARLVPEELDEEQGIIKKRISATRQKKRHLEAVRNSFGSSGS